MKHFMTAALTAGFLTAAAVPGFCQTELTMYYPIAVGGPLTKVVDGLIDGFQKENPDIHVNAIYAGNYDDTRVRALSALQSGQPANISVLFSIDAYDLIEQDLIVPFEDVATSKDDQAWLKGFYPALMANGHIQDKTWGIPFQRSTIVMYYNKDKFKEAGLDPEMPPQTWDELVADGKKLTKNGQYGIMIPGTGYPYWMLQCFAIQNGKELMSDNGTKVHFDDPAVVEGLSFWHSLSAEHKIAPEGLVEWGTLRQAFIQGQTAIMWHTTGNLTAVKKEATFNFGVAPLPAHKQAGSPTGGGNFYIFKKSTDEERAASLKLIRYLTSPDHAADWSIATGYVGVSPAAYKTGKLEAYGKEFPAALVARDQLKVAVAEFSTWQTARVREALNNAVQAALTGTQSPADALKAAQASADELLKPYQK